MRFNIFVDKIKDTAYHINIAKPIGIVGNLNALIRNSSRRETDREKSSLAERDFKWKFCECIFEHCFEGVLFSSRRQQVRLLQR